MTNIQILKEELKKHPYILKKVISFNDVKDIPIIDIYKFTI